ncbi:hypothetical protein WA026_005619 [Henosepilachna vigintioctopunctata]|uniref:Serpin domain-containing protein n=1 Tax=Henosepilachna vigintioctopunctata TaxID=420089 RepID=A0AAW1TTB8_9CUCU
MGARGKTAEQLKNILKLNGSDEHIEEDFKVVTSQLNGAKDVTIKTAIKAYLAEGIPIETEFQRVATEYFDAEVQNINFKDSMKAINSINSWVEKKTENKIKNLLQEGSIDESTRFIFIDTLYYLGHFLNPFEIWATQKKDFYLSKTRTVKVDMMQLSANVLFSRDATIGVNMIALPYQDPKAQLLIILPDSIERTGIVETYVMKMWQNRNFTNQYVKIFLPKFKVKTTFDFIPTLKKMGITELFNTPDLSGITKEKIALSSITQKTIIDVNEFGTEAASATSIHFVPTSLVVHSGEPILFNVDRPFIFAVLYDGLCILAGRVEKP